MSEHPLPPFWTQETDAKGRQFYCNHATQTTQWERPAPYAPYAPYAPPAPPAPPVQQAVLAFHDRRVVPAHHVPQPPTPRRKTHCKCNARFVFWVAAAMVLPVWIFSVSVALDDNWLEGTPLTAVNADILYQCNDDDVRAATNDFCNLYASFMMVQLVATLLASLALFLVTMALFLPAAVWCCSAKALGVVGGCAVASSAFFQLLALVAIICIERAESDVAIFFNDSDPDYDIGGTFGVAVVGFIFAIFDSAVLLTTVSSAGDGLFYECLKSLTSPER